MFIQVISGTVTDADEMDRLSERWEKELRPGATGFLGVTQGVTDDDRFVVLARFESAEAAAKNSARPEQGEWFAEMEKVVKDVTFHDCSRVETLFGGGKNEAKFVQVMQGRIKDKAKADSMFTKAAEAEKVLGAARPDVIGEVVAIHDDGNTYTDVVYFSSEEEARANEAKPMPDEAQEMMKEMDDALEVTEYLDLRRLHIA
jgi:heme-degrading monooxygenase HmoA